MGDSARSSSHSESGEDVGRSALTSTCTLLDRGGEHDPGTVRRLPGDVSPDLVGRLTPSEQSGAGPGGIDAPQVIGHRTARRRARG